MELKEFMNLKVGDKVRIVSEKKGDHWNEADRMDKWLGKVMTVKIEPTLSFHDKNYYIRMVEDKGEYFLGEGWFWFPHMIEKKLDAADSFNKLGDAAEEAAEATIKLTNLYIKVSEDIMKEELISLTDDAEKAADGLYNYAKRVEEFIKEKKEKEEGSILTIICDGKTYNYKPLKEPCVFPEEEDKIIKGDLVCPSVTTKTEVETKEPETMKVVCVKAKECGSSFTVGKVYEWVNGFLTDDYGFEYCYSCLDPDPSKWTIIGSKFVKLVEDDKKRDVMRVVCVESRDSAFTVGKVYERVNGELRSDSGYIFDWLCSDSDPSKWKFMGVKFIKLVE